MCDFLRCHFVSKQRKVLIRLSSACNVNFTNGTALKSVQVNSFLLQCFFTVRRMQSNFFRYHFGLKWEKRVIVRRVHAKRILQTAPHIFCSDSAAKYELICSALTKFLPFISFVDLVNVFVLYFFVVVCYVKMCFVF